MSACPFCERLGSGNLMFEEDSAAAFLDAYPVSEGHTLIVPRRHAASFFDLTLAEQTELLRLLDHVRKRLEEAYQPQGFNVGINVGAAAGQTVEHVHVHLIPRYVGDVPDPRGGIRHVIPGRGHYPIRNKK